MALSKQGTINGVALQPGYSLTYKDDGTIDGTCVFIGDASVLGLLPEIGSRHPSEPKCELYARDISFITNGRIQMTGSYFGLTSKKTDPVLTSTTNADRLPIELHPSFANLGGTVATPANGAKFDTETDEFLGFFDSESDLFGVQFFFSPSVQVSLSYWTRDVPKLDRLMSIFGSIDGYKKPDGVKDFLLIGQPTRQVGNHYQVTEQYLGSGPDGWNTNIYGL